MRMSFIEAACLVAIGVAMVELHGNNRPGATGSPSGAVLAAAKPAVVSPVPARDPLTLMSNESHR